MNFSFIDHLTEKLAEPLPGLSAQLEMTSQTRGQTWEIREDHRKSGVLVLFYPHQAQWNLVFMKRTEDGKVHGGQISFPGGKIEPSDPDPTFTALREAEEELGISPDAVTIIGNLTPLYIPPSNFLVYPSVGVASQRPEFIPSPDEVEAVIETDIETLLAPETKQDARIKIRQDLIIKAPAFMVEGHVIWGATAMMLSELLTVIREFR